MEVPQKIKKRGFVAAAVGLALSLFLGFLIAPAVGTACVFVTVAIVVMFKYAYDLETGHWDFNPVYYLFSILLLLALALLVLASLLIK